MLLEDLVPGTRYQVLYLAPAPRFFCCKFDEYDFLVPGTIVVDTRDSALASFQHFGISPEKTEHDDCEITR